MSEVEATQRMPKTLREAFAYFSNPDNCISFLVAHRPEWKDGVTCPTCGSKDVSYMPSRRVWQCKTRHPQAQFSVKVGTIMEDSALPLDKWLIAIWMQVSMKNGVSSWEIHRTLGISQKCAWHMLHRIRLGLQSNSGGKLSGQIEADETFIGGKARNMHSDVRTRRVTGTGGKDKTPVMGILERGASRESRVRVKIVDSTKKKVLQSEIRDNVLAGPAIFTDALMSYEGLDEFKHDVVDHAVEYVRGEVHTNGLENFWSLLKRGIKGTYVSVEPYHLFRYLDEQAFRYNERCLTDSERFSMAVSQIAGKRLTYADLIGKDDKKQSTVEPL